MDEKFLRELGVTQALLDHLYAGDMSHPFGYRCHKPHYWQSSPMAGREIVALWECGTVLNYFDKKTRYFEQCNLENIDDVWGKYTSIQGLLAELFIDAYEDELEIPLLTEYAGLFGFRCVQRLLIEIQSVPGDYGRWRQQFCSSCC